MKESLDSTDHLDCEDQPFLPSGQVGKLKTQSGTGWQNGLRTVSKTALWVHLILILFYTTLSVAVILSFHEPLSQQRRNALPELDTHFEHREYGMMRDSPYIGVPSPKVDGAWNTLFGNMSLRFTAEELARTSQSSVALPDGGHLAWLGVYHELHCVKVLRQANYREHYHPNLTDQELRDLQVHADHCIDQLREALMCHGDTESLTTFIWSDRWEKPLLSPQRPQHRCLDWDAMVASMRERIVNDEELGRLRRPDT